jgi:hypothetical protein
MGSEIAELQFCIANLQGFVGTTRGGGEVWVANVVVNVRLSLARKNFVIYQKGRSTLYPTVYSKFAVVKALCG